MLDFVKISIKETKKGVEIKPVYLVKDFKDLMVKGGCFCAVWNEETGMWSTDEYELAKLVDNDIYEKVREYSAAYPEKSEFINASTLSNFSSGAWMTWKRFVGSLSNNYHELDSKVIFNDVATCREDYASKKLPYSLSKDEPVAYDELMDTLYDPDERAKLEWAIGAIFTGDSKNIQKFIVLYGEPGSGKSTFLNIVQDLFFGYFSTFDAKTLASGSAFAIEAFKDNPLVAIQHDGDLSRIADNTKLNSIVSHEYMTINEKFKSAYTNRFNSFLFMGTNRPVMISEAKSGIIRRLIDVRPSGRKVPKRKYEQLVRQVKFELGAIANHCIEVFKEMGPNFYNSYRATGMMGATNDMYNFVEDASDTFLVQDYITLKQAWAMYKDYAQDANIAYPFSMKVFKEELKSYFDEFSERRNIYDPSIGRGTTVRNVYSGFKPEKVGIKTVQSEHEAELADGKIGGDEDDWLIFKEQDSVLDEVLADCPAQYAELKEDGSDKPVTTWAKNKTRLKDLDTHRLHYLKAPPTYIFADFDIKDETGHKSFELNLEAARKWPPTYAELSKSGEGIHLHYIYTGDPNRLNGVFGKNVEIKVQKGNSAIRRKLTKCNNLAIAKISSGLPLKEDPEKVLTKEVIKTEKELVNKIKYALAKKTNLGGTKSNVEFIKKLLDDAYISGLKYDVTPLRQAILTFAAKSTHHADYCLKLVDQMHFKSDEPAASVNDDEADIIFLDVEVFPNLFIVCWKIKGKDEVYKAINPDSTYVEQLFKYKIVGFNNRKYDNHILWGRYLGYTNEQLYLLSQRNIEGSENGTFAEAYNLSYADVYDFSSKKQSLKKWEIELGIHHQENAYPWDQPVAEEHWDEIAEYCANDVIATEKVFEARHEDFNARKLLAELSGLTPNDTNRQHITRILLGKDKVADHVYTNLATGEQS